MTEFIHLGPVLAVLLAAVAAWTDFRKGIIPNWLSFGGLVLGPVWYAVYGAMIGGVNAALVGAVLSLLGALVCGAIPMFLYMTGGGRGGDVKLLAAVGALCRATIGIEAVFYSFIVAALYAGARLAYEGKLLRTFGNVFVLLYNIFAPKARRRPLSKEAMTWTRLGPSVLVGTAVAVLLTWRIP